MTISAKDVKQLREITGAGMMDCKRALVESDGDINAAEIKLKELGLSAAAKRSGRATTEGRIFTTGDKSGAILELSSETDFVARYSQFIELGESLVRIIVEQRLLDSTNQIQELVTEAIGKIKENIEVRRFSYIHVEDSEYLATYIHGEGTIGVVVKLSVDDKSLTNDSRVQALAFDLCLHVAAMGPEFLDKESVSSDRINEFKKLMSQYNGVKDKPHGFYDFKNIDIESAGERDPDADDATGMSASKLRDLAVDGDFEAFKTGLPDTLSEKDKRSLYQLVRKQMKLSVMEKQRTEKLSELGKLPPYKKTKIKSPSKAKQKQSTDDFIGGLTPDHKPAEYDDDDVALKKAKAAIGYDPKEGLWMENIEFEGKRYNVDSRAVKIFNYIKTLPYNSKEITYIKGCLKECEGFFENYTLITKKIRLWEISKLREFIKRTNDYIMILDENSGMIDFNKTDFTYLHEMIDNLPKDESNLQDPVSNKLQNLLGLKEWNKNRDKEGQQLEFGTDKYRQYTVDLTPGEEFKQEQEKERLQQSERYNKILSKILASRSK